MVVYSLLSALGLGFLGWLWWRILKRSEDPAKFVFKSSLTAVLVLGEIVLIHSLGGNLKESSGLNLGNFGNAAIIAGSIGVLGVVLSIIWTSEISAVLFSPLTNLFDGGNQPPEPKPFYSIAQARRKMRKPLEAIMLIREQLERFPDDFEGVMLLAKIQAEDLNDLPGAEITLNHFCNSPCAPERQVVAAYTQLADWHLKKTADVDSAREALRKIVEHFPETEFALRAEQRIAHLAETDKLILAQHSRQPIPVPEGVKNIGLLDSTEFLRPKEIEPRNLAAVYVTHLEQHPHDSEVREKLATIYARDFKRLDMATLELEQLINEPRHTPKQIAGWLNLLATFQVELGADVATVVTTLEIIVERFPDLPVADAARSRLARVNLEFKGKQATPNVKLGVYEQNIGLKYGPPRKD